MSITKKIFGQTMDGQSVDIFTLSNSRGVTAEITNYGGIVVSLRVPDRKGNFEDVVLGYDKFEGYLKNEPYLGAIIGRNSNRIKNATFEINGQVYPVSKNAGAHQLHGGFIGFDKVVWKATIIQKSNIEALQLEYTSKDGEEGYPGTVEAKVIYTLTEENGLEIEYFAVSDKDTVVNMTNHAYFNLAGHGAGSVSSHKVKINADTFTVIDGDVIPTGEIRDVKGTPMDFTEFTSLEPGLTSNYEQITLGNGYDHNWVLNVSGNSPEKAAEVLEENSGRLMEVYTTKPGIQLYTGNFLDIIGVGKKGATYGQRGGLCLETQYFPNALEHKHFPSPILKAGQEYKHITIYKFLTR